MSGALGFDALLSKADIADAWAFFAHVAQLAEHVLGKDEVSGSNPLVGSTPVGLRRGREAICVCRAVNARETVK